MRKNENSCKGCEFLGSDSCRDIFWYVCSHDSILEEYPEALILNQDLETPDWCPLRISNDDIEIEKVINYIRKFKNQIKRVYGSYNHGSVFSPVYTQENSPPDQIIIVFK